MDGPAQKGLKEVMRVYPQGVTVVTAMAREGAKGITVSSFVSVSLEPPLVLVSLSKSSANHDIIAGAKEFAVNFLADDQRSVSDRFAGRVELKDRFDGLSHRSESSLAPIIAGVRAFIECRTWRVYDGGDHSLVLGEVTNAVKLNDKNPLVYYKQQYTTVVPPESASPSSEISW